MHIKKHFPTRVCMFTALGLGEKKHTFSHTHILEEAQWVKHTHTHSKGKWERTQTVTHTLQQMKCILRVDQKNVQSPSPCSPEQGIQLERGDISEGSLATLLWAQEHQEMTHLPIRESELEDTAEWTQGDRVAIFHGRNNRLQKAAYGECRIVLRFAVGKQSHQSSSTYTLAHGQVQGI